MCSRMRKCSAWSILDSIFDGPQTYPPMYPKRIPQCIPKCCPNLSPYISQKVSPNLQCIPKCLPQIRVCRCAWILDESGHARAFTPEMQENVTHQVIEAMASEGLRTICVAYKDFLMDGTSGSSGASGASNVQCITEEPDWDDEANLIKDLTCLAILGIEDPVRDEVILPLLIPF